MKNKVVINRTVHYTKSKKQIEKYQFKSLNYDFSKKIDSFSFNKYKSKKISEIFKENTSPKYKKYNNVDVYDNIIQINKELNNILNKPYLEKTNENFEVYLKRIVDCINSDFISNKFFFLIKK